MAEKQETIADIIAEKRLRAAEMEKTLGDQHSFVESLKDDADRIEAAWKREKSVIEADALAVGGIVGATAGKSSVVGDAARLREALEPWIAFAEWLLENAGKDALGVAIRDNGPIIRQRLEELRAALSAPPRNCDKYNDEVLASQAFMEAMPYNCYAWSCADLIHWMLSSCKEGGAK